MRKYASLLFGFVACICIVFISINSVNAASNGPEVVSLGDSKVQPNSSSSYGKVTPDGRYVVFTSSASNLVPGGVSTGNQIAHVYRHDIVDGSTVLISVNNSGTPANDSSSTQMITPDGRYVLFQSSASNLGTPSSSQSQCYLRDIQQNNTILIKPFSQPATCWSMNGDGNYITIQSDTSNVPGYPCPQFPCNWSGASYLLNRSTGTLEPIAINSGGQLGFINSSGIWNSFQAINVSISDDGNIVAFQSSSPLIPGVSTGHHVYVRNLATENLQVVVPPSGLRTITPVISKDGRYVAYIKLQSSGASTVVYIRNLETGVDSQVDITPSGDQPNNFSDSPSISSDGQYVAFRSRATNLVPGGSSSDSHVFVRNIFTSTTAQGDVNKIGEQAVTNAATGGVSHSPEVIDDGSIVFWSYATNLSNTPSPPQVYINSPLHRAPPAPTISASSPTQNPILNWVVTENTDSYNIYRNNVLISTSTSTAFTDTSASEGNVVYYVTSVNSSGESSPSNTVNIVVDRTAPSINYVVNPSPNIDSWNLSSVSVAFTCEDALSGVATCSNPVNITNEGINQQASGAATDNAGNSASVTVTLNIDKTNPNIGYTISPTPNNNGWNNSDTTVNFNCSDVLSGVKTCSAPVTLSSNGANQSVEGSATDLAGNSTSILPVVNIDKIAPTINYTVSPSPNTGGWNSDNVTITFNCSDNDSGIEICPEALTLTSEGAGQIIEGTATDKAGNSASVAVIVNIDKSAPVVTNINWSANPLQQGQPTTLSVSEADGLSGTAIVKYSVDGGAAQNMFYDSTNGMWKATFGANLAVNTYNISIVATDLAGNNSAELTDILAIYTTANGYVTGHARLLPTDSDSMPIARDTSNNPAKLIVGFTNVTAPMSGSFDISYVIKNNQNEFNLSSTSIDWVVIQDSMHASILGRADMLIYVNGVQTLTQNTAVKFDIVLGTNGADDYISIKIFNPGIDPNTGTPTYVISGNVVNNGSNLMIHP